MAISESFFIDADFCFFFINIRVRIFILTIEYVDPFL